MLTVVGSNSEKASAAAVSAVEAAEGGEAETKLGGENAFVVVVVVVVAVGGSPGGTVSKHAPRWIRWSEGGPRA